MPPNLESTIREIGTELLRRSWMMGTAESCTGGLVAAAMTAIPGSSAWFAGAVVTYATAWKERLLAVPRETIQTHGVVSESTVAAMLQGLQKQHGLDAGIAISGIAGPGGAEPGKPIGTVVIGVCAGKLRHIQTCHFPGDRNMVRQAAVEHALGMLHGALLEIPGKGWN